MPTSVAAEMAANTAILVRLERRFEEDYKERKEASKETELARKAVSDDLSKMQNSQDDILRRLDRIEPVTDLVTSWRGKLAGIMIVMGFIGALATFVIVFFKDFIVGWFQ